MDILRWIGEQYAVRFDHLQLLAGRLTQNTQVTSNEGLKYKATYRFSTRWVKAGLAERKKIFVGQPPWLWLTKEGLQAVGLDLDHRPPAISRLAHIHAVNSLRLYVEAKLGDRARWICEREANAFRKVNNKRHLVDGEIEYEDGLVVGVEVELTQKRSVRLHSILRELKKDYNTVWYFASQDSYNAVKHGIEQIPGYDETFILHSLSSIIEGSE